MDSVVSQLVADVEIPKMAVVRQIFSRPQIEVGKIAPTIFEILDRPEFASRVKPGMSIAITAGSRGIANVALITKAIVDFCKQKGAYPFIIPAMGSHGGASAEGQLEILHSYGITEEYLGCPLRASMETVHIGRTEEGHEVLIDKYAAEADGIIISCRVKPHTCFRGEYESGIMKMITIGLGKQEGADVCHREGFGRMAHFVPLFGKAIIKNAPILFALAVIENAFDETCRLEGVLAEDIEAVEPALLKDAFAHMPKIMFEECDLLIIDRIGKNFSGDGADPNITGTFGTPYASGGLKSQKVAILGLSEESHGNANGIGMADATTRRAFEQMDFDITYPNSITCRLLSMIKIPMVMRNDKEAIQVCLRCLEGVDMSKIRVVRISNSLHIEHIMVSESLLEEAERSQNVVVESGFTELKFDEHGNLQPIH